jgi:hypothetical protein
MASIITSAIERPTVELDAEVIIGAASCRRRIALECLGCDAAPRLDEGESRLLLAINPTIPFMPLENLELREMARGNERFYLQFPAWMDVQTQFAAWQSQSVSGAVYLSRTDLRAAFGVAGVLLLQVLPVAAGQPCLTSRHYHRQTREIFDPLDAELGAEYRRGDARWRPLRERLEVPPGVRHQLRRAKPGYSVNLIQMYGASFIRIGPEGPMLDMSDHIYC